MKAKKPLVPGDTIHFLIDGLSFPRDSRYVSSGVVSRRGLVAVVTDRLLEANKDRNGDCWLDLIDDSEAQQKRWGQVAFARGPWPKDLETLVPGSPEFREAREEARKEAWAASTEREREANLAAVEARFGPNRTSTFLPARGFEGLS